MLMIDVDFFLCGNIPDPDCLVIGAGYDTELVLQEFSHMDGAGKQRQCLNFDVIYASVLYRQDKT